MGFVPKEMQAFLQLIKHVIFSVFLIIYFGSTWAEVYNHSHS